jgi:hypothetical protein
MSYEDHLLKDVQPKHYIDAGFEITKTTFGNLQCRLAAQKKAPSSAYHKTDQKSCTP